MVEQPASFTTRRLPDPERIPLWEQHNAQALIALRCRTLESPTLDATEINTLAGPVGLARVTGSPHIVERTPEMIREHPTDAVACYLTLRGKAFFYHDDGVSMLSPGRLLVCDADRPFLRGFSHGLEELAIRIPRDVFDSAVPDQPLRTPVVKNLTGRSLHGRTLSDVVGRAVRAQDPHPAEMSLVLGLIGTILRGAPEDLAAMHLATAQTFIRQHLTDPDLSAAGIAQAIGVSPRHLSRVFATADLSVPQFILARRLDHAHALLTASPELTVQELTTRSGLQSASYFSHAFRERFGRRVSDARREARAHATRRPAHSH